MQDKSLIEIDLYTYIYIRTICIYIRIMSGYVFRATGAYRSSVYGRDNVANIDAQPTRLVVVKCDTLQ